MAVLDWITIKGFKSIRSIERLQLRPINVLIGPNGSGKSNFIGAFSLAIATGLVMASAIRISQHAFRKSGTPLPTPKRSTILPRVPHPKESEHWFRAIRNLFTGPLPRSKSASVQCELLVRISGIG